MRAPWRGKFDRDRDFEVRRKITVSGETFYPGQPFDKTLVTTRRLRQLFDHRTLIYPGTTPGAILSPEGEDARTRRRRRKLVKAVLATVKEGGAPAPVLTPAGDGSDTFPERTAVVIPDDWKTLPWPKRLQLAASLSATKIHNSDEAVASVEAELARRGRAS